MNEESNQSTKFNRQPKAITLGGSIGPCVLTP